MLSWNEKMTNQCLGGFGFRYESELLIGESDKKNGQSSDQG